MLKFVPQGNMKIRNKKRYMYTKDSIQALRS